jgi:putative ABC transport system permease protein
MFSVFRTLSRRYLIRHRFRTLAIVVSIALGVATLVATRVLARTMDGAAAFAANPTAGAVDLIVSNGELTIPRTLGEEIARVPGVRAALPAIFASAYLADHGDAQVLVMGLDVLRAAAQTAVDGSPRDTITLSPGTEVNYLRIALSGTPVIVGKQLADRLGDVSTLSLRRGRASHAHTVGIAGTLQARAELAALAGDVVLMDIAPAAALLQLPSGHVHQFHLHLERGADLAVVRERVQSALRGRAEVRTPQEQSELTQNVMSIVQSMFSLCGIAALVVGAFLVYSALSVSVAERRHEIGILLSVGATRRQILLLFTGEALVLGLLGSLAGIPLGIGLARLGLASMQDVLRDIVGSLGANHVHQCCSIPLMGLALGVTTTLLASLLPALEAARENPARAVRRTPRPRTAAHLLGQLGISAALVCLGSTLILFRSHLPSSLGTLGGLLLVLMGALASTPLFAALGARLVQPLLRHHGSVEWRLAADNIVRAPGRTGLVIGALAAGVSLVVQTAGVIRSNRIAIGEWLEGHVGSDLIISSGSLVGMGGQMHPMPANVLPELEQIEGVEAVLPIRMRKVNFRTNPVMLLATDAGLAHRIEKDRHTAPALVALYKQLDDTTDGAFISDNLAALQKLKIGDTVTVPAPNGEVRLRILGVQPDYAWSLGTITVHRRDYLRHWQDSDADVFDVYLERGASVAAVRRVKEEILRRHGAAHGMFALTRSELKEHTDRLVEQLYGVAYAQQLVVMIVAGLGVVTALIISVLQRRREMGMLRAIGAARSQVIRSVLAEACLMGVLGSVIGLIVGVPLEWYVLRVVILEETGFLFPVYVPWVESLWIVFGALLTATLAGVGPALMSVRERIPDAIAYE